MEKTYEDILKEVIDNATIEEVFNINDLQKVQDEFAKSLNIAAIITDLDGNPVTAPSNFTGLCGNYIRMTENGLNLCRCSDAFIGSADNSKFMISKCYSAGIIDGGVGLYLGKRHIANWIFGQIRYPDDVMTDEMIIKKSLELRIDPEDFEREYNLVPVMEHDRFNHIARLAAIIAKKYSDESYLKCVHIAEERHKMMIQQNIIEDKERLEYENRIDFLTKLLTRNSFEQELKNLELLQTVPVAVIVADVNNLKLTNDIFGHKFGDQLLEQIAGVMMEESFDGYIIGRCGGDEFNVLIPDGNRQSAEWFCHRVNHELSKNYNCCVMPSVAFGVGKKGHPEEKLKDLMEIADQKMYRQKIMIKQQETFYENLKRVLTGKGRLTDEAVAKTHQLTAAFAEYLELDLYQKDAFMRMVEIHIYGTVVLSDKMFANRFDPKPSLEQKRELSKISLANAKLANLYPEYMPASDALMAFYENWNGSGVPNGISGNDIPKLSRLGRIVCDFSYAMFEPPIGIGKDRRSAAKMLSKGAGKQYDPEFTKSFQRFISKFK